MVLAVHMHAFFLPTSKLFLFFSFADSKRGKSKKSQNRLELNIYHKKTLKMDKKR